MPTAVRGRDATIFVDALDASTFLNEYEIESEADDIEVVPFGEDKYFLAGPIEHSVTLTGYWNGDAGSLDEILDETFNSGAEKIVTICGGGAFSGKAAYLLGGVQVSNNVSAESDDVSEVEVEFRSVRDRGVLLKDPTPVTATGQGTANVSTAATSKGGVAHLHVLDIAGGPTSVAIQVEGSPDGTTWTPLVTFSTISTPKKTAEKIRLPRTTSIPEQLRVKHTITGGSTPSVSYVVAFARGR
jgi:hypothetical protein